MSLTHNNWLFIKLTLSHVRAAGNSCTGTKRLIWRLLCVQCGNREAFRTCKNPSLPLTHCIRGQYWVGFSNKIYHFYPTDLSIVFPILIVFGIERQFAEGTVTFSEPLSSVWSSRPALWEGGKEREMEIERDVIIVASLD